MPRSVTVLAVVLVVGASVAFLSGMRALERDEDRAAVYWLVVGALGLRSAAELARPRSAS